MANEKCDDGSRCFWKMAIIAGIIIGTFVIFENKSMIGNGKKKLQKEKSENEILRLSKNNVLKPTIITHVQCVARDAQKNTRSLTMRHGANDALNGIVVIAKWNVLRMNDSFTLLMESLRRDFEITFADNNSIVCDIEWGIS